MDNCKKQKTKKTKQKKKHFSRDQINFGHIKEDKALSMSEMCERLEINSCKNGQ